MGRIFKITEYTVVLIIGAMAYGIIEIIWRGFTHWTMMLTGGVCMTLICLFGEIYNDVPLWKKCIIGSLIITNAELSVGFFVNILLGWNVWSYINMKFNFYGLICPLYTVLWFLLSIPANLVCDILRRGFENIKAKFSF